jgi:phage terminase large subunit-like protein
LSASGTVERQAVYSLPVEWANELFYDWETFGRVSQRPPAGDWTTWLLMGGRGSGKTRAGAEWIRELVMDGISPIALVGETITEAVSVMVRGESGILKVTPARERPVLRGDRLLWPNGCEAMILGASDPERFRGPQFAAAWCDEIGKWRRAEEAWDMLQFGLRLGHRPRQLATTTPRSTTLMKRLLADPQTVLSRMTTAENRTHLATCFLDAVVKRYQGSVLGRQELEGELIEDRPDALWQRSGFQRWAGGDLDRIVVAVDPPVTGTETSDACGIIVAGRQGETGVVLADATVQGVSPLDWARRAIAAYHAHEADCLVVEVNQGGDLVRSVLDQIDPSVPVKAVRATRGKWLRAEPVAALYGRGMVSHAAGLTALEDEMCSFGGDGSSQGRSPDRVDALVWALTDLLLAQGRPRVRRI